MADESPEQVSAPGSLTAWRARAGGRIAASALACAVNVRNRNLRRAQAAFGLCRRTASVRAATPLTLRALHRPAFLTAMTGYSRSAHAIEAVITEHLNRTDEAKPHAIRGDSIQAKVGR